MTQTEIIIRVDSGLPVEYALIDSNNWKDFLPTKTGYELDFVKYKYRPKEEKNASAGKIV